MFDESLELEAELEAELEREAAAIAADEELPPDMEEEARSVPAAAAPAAAPAGAPPPVDDEEDGCAAAMEGVEEQPAAAQQAMDEDEDEEAAVVEEEREVLRTFGATLEDGREGVVRMLAPRARNQMDAARSGSLLAQPIAMLRDELDRQATERRAAAERAATLEQAAAASAAAAADGTDAGTASASDAPPPPTQLWVDKYAPHKFMELLSDERVNRQVLHWVKGWDEHVFGRAVKGSGARERAAASAARAIGMGASTRPDRPLLLISGPPGLGKTTLAHVVAKHAGYRPVEINASDERSAKVLKQRVSEATEMQSVYGDRRPPLIILDEIDGALGGSEGSGAIHELLKLANLSGGGGGDSSSPAKGSKTKGAHASKGLQRPVVCVCNDVHAPALRPLRAVAETIEFRAASNSQLLGRLRYVCREEKLAADPQLLAGLAQLSGNDVRTCLNTLQFVAAKSDTLTEAALASVGGKVVGKSPLALWKQVFVATPPKPASSGGGSSAASKAGGILGGKSAGASHPRTTRAGGKGADQAAALRTTSASVLYKDLELSDVGRVLDGVHENYLHVSYTDPQVPLTPTLSLTPTLALALSLALTLTTYTSRTPTRSCCARARLPRRSHIMTCAARPSLQRATSRWSATRRRRSSRCTWPARCLTCARASPGLAPTARRGRRRSRSRPCCAAGLPAFPRR